MGFNLWNRLFKPKITPGQAIAMGNTFLSNIPVANWSDLDGAVHEGYCKSDTVYSIIKRIATTAAKTTFGEYKIVNEKSYKDYQHAITHFKAEGVKFHDIKDLRYKSVEPVDSRITKVYNQPNEEQTGSELTLGAVSYKLITGNHYEYYVKAGTDGRPLEVHLMPSHLMEIVANKNTFPVSVAGYKLNDGKIRDFEKKEIVHTKEFNPIWDFNGSQLVGMSPLRASWLTVQGDNEGAGAMAEQLKNRGPSVVAWFKSHQQHVNDDAGALYAGQIREKFYQAYTKEYKDSVFPIYAEGKLDKIGLPLADMQILEARRFNLKELCNVYGVSDILFNSDTNAKYDNYQTAVVEMITGAVLPQLIAIRDSRNRFLTANKHLKPGSILDFDPTVYTELEASRETLIKWMKGAPLTMNQRLIYLGEEPVIGNPVMDEVFVSRDYIRLSDIGTKPNDLNTNQPMIDENANEGL